MIRNALALGAVAALTCALALPSTASASHGVTLVNMSQKDPNNGNATVAVGGIASSSQIGFQVSSGSSTCGSGYWHRVQFEVKPAGAAFSGAVSYSSPWYSNFKPSCVVKAFPQQNYTAPSTSGAWHWRVRELTSTNGGSSVSSTGPWTDFGGNGTNADFVTNQPPVAEANGPYTGTQGVLVMLTAAGSSDADGTIVSYEWDCTDDGVYDTVGSNTSSGCTYPDDGVYTARLRVTDDDGSQATDTATVTVPNVGPTAEANGPYTGTRGFAVAVSGAGSTDSDGAITQYAWDCDGDGAYEAVSASPVGSSCVFSAVGTYTIELEVTDDDGAVATDTATVTVGNDPPTADAGGPYTGDEGSPVPLNGAASSDVGGGAVVLWEWDCTDDGLYDISASSGVGNGCTYTDDGVFTVRLKVTDDDGATAEATSSVTVGNLAPSIASMTGPTTGDEGSALSFATVATDPGADDVPTLAYTWSWGDGTADSTGLSPSHTWDDEGTYTVTLLVDDQDGGTDTDTLEVVVSNVAPIIDSSPTTSAPEGALWSYAPTAIDPGADTLTWSLSASAPAAMTIDPATGLMEWTPTYADAVVGSASMVLTVDDGDAGTDAQSITLTVTVLDDDADGLPDGWETANGLDPTDPNDATGDPDGDGMTNLDELAEGTDPQSYDGPSAPVLTAPIAAEEVVTTAPDLFWDNAVDPQGEALLYDVEVYEDAAMTVLAASMTAVAEDLSGTSTWKVDVVLTENALYTWRARANDAWVAGPWSAEETFVVNATNEAPEVPVLTFPIGGEVAASASPTMLWAESGDIDGDTVSYDIEIYDLEENVVASATGVVGSGVSGEWTVDVALAEDTVYLWSAVAVDEHGLASLWAPAEEFFYSTENAAPFGTVFIDPPDESTLDEAPVLSASEGEDPEGGTLEYLFEVDSSASFDSGSEQEMTVPASGTGVVTWDLSAVALAENAWTYARVRAIDEGGVTSTPDTISFFVRGDNDAPAVPVLLAPADGAEVEAVVALEVEDPEDPEGDIVFIDFVVARDAELTDIVSEVQGVITGGGATTWTPGVNLEGTLYWSARAVDADGASSDWAAPWSMEAPVAEAPGDDDDSAGNGDGDGTGCECQSSVSAGASPAVWALLLLLVPMATRRRR